MLHYSDNTKDYIKMLERSHGGLAISGSQTVNEGAERIKKAYEGELDKFTLRNKFTKGAIRINLSKPQRSTGEFRQLKNINAVVGVRKLKGGKEHYLALQEEGGTKGGSIQGKVAMPMDAARTSNSRARVVKGALQLQKKPAMGVLSFSDGKTLGTMNDTFNGGYRKGAQRWAILYKYSGLSRNPNDKKAVGRYGWDLSKQFFFRGMVRGFGLFMMVGSRIKMMRSIEKSSVRVKPTLKFAKSVNKISQFTLESIFIKNAKKFMGR